MVDSRSLRIWSIVGYSASIHSERRTRCTGTDKGKREGVVKPDMVSNYSLNYREDRPTYDGHIQDAEPAST